MADGMSFAKAYDPNCKTFSCRAALEKAQLKALEITTGRQHKRPQQYTVIAVDCSGQTPEALW
jgi:hypothetical protein